MDMVALRKERAGSAAGTGPDGPWMFTWDSDNAVVEVPDYVAHELMTVGGFTQAGGLVRGPEITEPAPKVNPVSETPKPTGRKAAAKKPATEA